MSEHRKFTRVYEVANVTLINPWNGDEITVSSRDISKGGIRLYSQEKLNQEIDYQAIISFASFPSKIKSCLRIVWIEMDNALGKYECGAEFTSIEDYDRVILSMLIDARE